MIIGGTGVHASPDYGGPAKVKKTRYILVAVVALILVVRGVFAVKGTFTANAEGRQKYEKKKADRAKSSDKHKPVGDALPKPIGPENAPVKITVFVSGTNSCHSDTVTSVQELAAQETYKDKMRVEFLDTAKPEVKKIADASKIGCEAGLLINGKSTMIVPGHGEMGLVVFSGPMGKKNYTRDDLIAAIAQVIKEKAAGKTK